MRASTRRLVQPARSSSQIQPPPLSRDPQAGPSRTSVDVGLLARRQRERYSNARKLTSHGSDSDEGLGKHKLARIEATKGGVVAPFLTDSFGREHDYLRISLTEKCNLRCTYCMPDEGAPLSPSASLLSTTEILRLASIFVSKGGVRKIRLTGGEPTIRKDLPEIIEGLSSLKVRGQEGRALESIGMTSNGIKLSRQLEDLVKKGLTHLNISLDTLDEHKFELVTRRRGHSVVMSAIRRAASLLSSGSDAAPSSSTPSLRSLKLNVVVLSTFNLDEITTFVSLTRDLPLSVRFIEYMPFDGNKWSDDKLVPSSSLLSTIMSQFGREKVKALEPGLSDTARTYRVEGFAGSFGFISSMTDHFCSGCSRLRIAADGGMKVCLFGEAKLSLRDLLRSGASDDDIAEAIGLAVKNKHFAHDGKSALDGPALNNYRNSSEFAGTLLAVPSLAKVTPAAGAVTALADPTFDNLIPTSGLPYSTSLPFAASSRRIPKSLLPYYVHTHPASFASIMSSISPSFVSHSQQSPPLHVRHFSSSRPLSQSHRKDGLLSLPPRLTHLSSTTGRPSMVSITNKSSSHRSAKAVGRVVIPKVAYDLLNSKAASTGGIGSTAKGDVMTVAQLAGIMAAKRTGELIPLCHPINLSNVQLGLELVSSRNSAPSFSPSEQDITKGEQYWIAVSCTTECNGSTGVEMEALIGVSVACNTIWDMLKAVAGKEMLIEGIKVISKSGGKSGDWERKAD